MYRTVIQFFLISGCLVHYQLLSVVDFEEEVWPILEERCVECHKAPFEQNGRRKEPKAGLRLDGAGHIMAGSDEGPVIVVDHPSKSSLYQRVILPSTDDDIMPPKGDPLTFKQQELIRKWIAQGVDFSKWVGAEDGVRIPMGENGDQRHELPEYLKFYDQLASGLKPIKPDRLIQFDRDSLLLIRPIGIGSSLLEVRVVTRPKMIDDQLLAQLIPLKDHICHLDLRETLITDQSCEVISKFKKLTKLNIRDTRIGDNGIKELLTLPNLQSLNLSQTNVSDNGINSLSLLAKLTTLHLWKSGVSVKGISRLRERKPLVEISF